MTGGAATDQASADSSTATTAATAAATTSTATTSTAATLPIDALRTQLRYIYNSYRTALLNQKYYGTRLDAYQKRNLTMEAAIALGATGSGGVAGFAIWGTITGHFAWLGISGVATILGIVKPFLKFGDQVEKYSKLYTSYGSIYMQLKSIVEDIDTQKSIPPKLGEKYKEIRTQVEGLGSQDDPNPDQALIRRLQGEVNEKIPPEQLWMP